jgi:xanthosine utilization system XapX-like protein
MESKQKPGVETIAHLLGRIDARVPLPLLGLAAGAAGGVAYTLDSAPHMVLPAPTDLYLVGLLLALLGAAAGWLAGAMISAPLRRSGQRGEGAPTAGPMNSRAADDRGARGRERA